MTTTTDRRTKAELREEIASLQDELALARLDEGAARGRAREYGAKTRQIEVRFQTLAEQLRRFQDHLAVRREALRQDADAADERSRSDAADAVSCAQHMGRLHEQNYVDAVGRTIFTGTDPVEPEPVRGPRIFIPKAVMKMDEPGTATNLGEVSFAIEARPSSGKTPQDFIDLATGRTPR